MNFVENFTSQNCTKKLTRNIAIEVAKTRQDTMLKRKKTNTFTDVGDTQGRQLYGFGALLKMVIKNQKSNAITAEF